MSPILKRDVHEQLRQARRLASVISPSSLQGDHEACEPLPNGLKVPVPGHAGSSSRQGIGIHDARSEDQDGRPPDRKGKARAMHPDAVLGDRDGAEEAMNGIVAGPSRRPAQSLLERHGGRLRDLRNLILEASPSLAFNVVGVLFTGELLEHLARWRVFRRVDELFILVPMLGNLKGNLEMCLSARLGTSANIGELNHRPTRQALISANLTLLGLQSLLISALAAIISFILGLITIHRLGDTPPPVIDGALTGIDPGLAVGEQEFHEGYTRPGWKQLFMVLATGMGAAGLSSAVLGSFMSSLVVLCTWLGVDPDNITPPVAACLGDLLTLFILALLGTLLVGTMDTPIPVIAVISMISAAVWFTRHVMRNQWVKSVAKGGWVPLIGAMLISSGTGMVLDSGVGKYRGFALLAISMTGLTGSIGAIHANRLSTSLHTGLHPSMHTRPGLNPAQSMVTLFLLGVPCQAAFVAFVTWAGWIDLYLGWAGWVTFVLVSAISLAIAHYLTLYFWSKNLDPDSYTLPIQSALVDLIGQCLLIVAYELCILQGMDVIVTENT